MGKIFEKLEVDYRTGEVLSITSLSTSKSNEQFGMHRRTDGLGWLFRLTGAEIKILITLLSFENPKTHIVTMGDMNFELLGEWMGMSIRQCKRLINSLEAKHALGKFTNTDYLLNPAYFYQGNSKNIVDRIRGFYQAYNEKYGTFISYETDVEEDNERSTTISEESTPK
jgi:hypothetical protein